MPQGLGTGAPCTGTTHRSNCCWREIGSATGPGRKNLTYGQKTGMERMTYEQFAEMWDGNSDSIECTTSGSTGTPKSIFLPKHEMRRSARRTIDFFGVGRDSLCTQLHLSGLYRRKNAVCQVPRGRMPFRLREAIQHSIGRILRRQDRYGVSGAVANAVHRRTSQPAGRGRLPGGRRGRYTTKLRKIIAARGIRAYETYGMTETAPRI